MDDRDRLLAILWYLDGAPVALEALTARWRTEVESAEAEVGPLVDALVAAGDVVRSDGGYAIAAGRRDEARAVSKRVMAAGFDEMLVRYADSGAYAAYSERVYGTGRFQFDIADGPQCEALLDALALRPGERFADLGCATGAMTRWIADRSGADGLGIDFAPAAIARARTEAAGNPRLAFEVGDLDALDLPPLDAVVSIDTLYFCADLPATVGRMVGALRPGGRFAALFSAGPRDAGLELERMRVGQALIGLGLTPRGTDFTEASRALWTRALEAVTALEGAFRAEGNTRLFEGIRGEAESVLKRYAAGQVRRWLVYATTG